MVTADGLLSSSSSLSFTFISNTHTSHSNLFCESIIRLVIQHFRWFMRSPCRQTGAERRRMRRRRRWLWRVWIEWTMTVYNQTRISWLESNSLIDLTNVKKKLEKLKNNWRLIEWSQGVEINFTFMRWWLFYIVINQLTFPLEYMNTIYRFVLNSCAVTKKIFFRTYLFCS